MANSYRHETLRETAAVNRLQVVTLIGSLSHAMVLLTADIEHEEAHAGVRDPADPAYPILAKSLRARRDNIRSTIASLTALINETPEADERITRTDKPPTEHQAPTV
jgi:hypothetical protein